MYDTSSHATYIQDVLYLVVNCGTFFTGSMTGSIEPVEDITVLSKIYNGIVQNIKFYPAASVRLL